MSGFERLRLFGLRWLFVYALFQGVSVVVGLVPMFEPLWVAYMEAWVPIVDRVGQHVFGVEGEIAFRPTGSGDTTFDWVMLFCQIALSSSVAIGWSVAARRPRLELRPMTHSLVRHLLAVNMISYGAVKVFSSQFGDLEPPHLVRTFGEMSPMGLLWSFMAYSDAYEVFTGLAELAAGVLLLWRRVTTLGALLTIGVTSNVVMLNYCYDVPVKILSTQLLLAGIWLVVPDGRRIFDVLVRGRAVEPVDLETWPRTTRARRAAMALKLAVVGGQAVGLATYFFDERLAEGEPKDPVLGMYEVESFTRNLEMLPPLLDDPHRWRRVGLFEEAFVIEPMSGQTQWRGLEHDPDAGTLAITLPEQKASTILRYATTPDGGLELHGMDGEHRIDATLRRIHAEDFFLRNRGFHWVNEFPLNR